MTDFIGNEEGKTGELSDRLKSVMIHATDPLLHDDPHPPCPRLLSSLAGAHGEGERATNLLPTTALFTLFIVKCASSRPRTLYDRHMPTVDMLLLSADTC